MPKSRGRRQKKRPAARVSGNPGAFDRLPEALDPTVEAVTKSFDAARARVAPLEQVLADSLPREPEVGTRLDAIASGDYLHAIRAELERRGEEVAQTYSAARWLWYTRRLSSELFAGRLVTTQHADHSMLESLTGLSRNEADGRFNIEGRSIYPFTVRDLVPVAELAAIAVALSQCHSWIRRAGKGTEFVVRAGDLPEPVADASLEAAIETFDDRVISDLGMRWHPSIEAEARNEDLPVLLGVSKVLGPWTPVLGWQGALEESRMLRISGQFWVQFMTLGGLGATIADAGQGNIVWWRRHTPSLVLLLQAVWYAGAFWTKTLGLNLPKVGYVRWPRADVVEAIDEVLKLVRTDLEELFPGDVPADGATVVATLEGVSSSLWPVLPGPVLRAVEDAVVVDVWAATVRLQHDVLVPPQVGGELVNSSARRFEAVVQDRVNQSPWRPSAAALSLTKGHLKIGDRTITDIDAVAERDGHLLLVSCKNIPFSPEYDAGDHRTVRNVASTIDGAVAFWHDVLLADLEATPVGSNYDVSGFASVRGVVVTPHVFYSRDATTLASSRVGSGDLRNAVSLGELIAFLERPSGAD